MACSRVLRKGLVSSLSKSLTGRRKSSFDPYIVVSDTSADNETGIQHYASALVHKGEILKVRFGDSVDRDSDRGEVEASLSAMRNIERFEEETGLKLRNVFHFADHHKVVRLFNGGGNMIKKSEDYVEMIAEFQKYYGLYLNSSVKVYRKYNKLVHFFARRTRGMGCGMGGERDLTYIEFSALFGKRVEDMSRDNASQAGTCKFKVKKKGLMRSYNFFTNDFGVPSGIIPK